MPVVELAGAVQVTDVLRDALAEDLEAEEERVGLLDRDILQVGRWAQLTSHSSSEPEERKVERTSYRCGSAAARVARST